MLQRPLRMSGVANRTNGIIIAQAKIHDLNMADQSPLWISGALAIAEAMAVVKSDWISPNKK